jgi:hypothetical protein
MISDASPPPDLPDAEPAQPAATAPESGEAGSDVAVATGKKVTLALDDLLLQDLKHPDTQQILLPAGTLLTEAFIKKILKLGLQDATLACLKPPLDRWIEALELSRGLPFDYAVFLEGKRIVEDLTDSVRKNALQEQREHVWMRASAWVGRMVELLLARDLDSYVDFRIYDAYRHSHPLNTAILSILIGEGLRMKRDRLVEIGMSGLMADIGKVRMPFGILNKPGRLTPEEFLEAQGHVEHSKAIVESFDFTEHKVRIHNKGP